MMSRSFRLRAGALLLSVAALPLASASLNTASIVASAAAPAHFIKLRREI